jgi:hypothetical protein
MKKETDMVLQGHFRNGVIVLDHPAQFPDGTAAEVKVLLPPGTKEEETPTLYERLKPIVGIATGLPADGSTRIDEDLYGQGQS